MTTVDDKEDEQMLLIRSEVVKFSKASGKSTAFNMSFLLADHCIRAQIVQHHQLPQASGMDIRNRASNRMSIV